MIDTDKCEHILYDTMFNPIDVYNVAEELLAEVKRLREAIEKMAIGMDEDWRHWQIELLKLIGKDWEAKKND